MSLTGYYTRNRDLIQFGAAFLGMVVSGIVLADLLTRAITDSPLRLTVRRLFEPVGMNAAAPGALLLGMFLTGLIFLALDQTKRPQSVVLGVVTLIGLAAMALNGQFIRYLGTGELSMTVLGVVVGVLYIGLDNIRQIMVVDPSDTTGSAIEHRRGSRLEFRSAERLIYTILAVIVITALFEAYTQYTPLVGPELGLNLEALFTFRFVNLEGGRIATDLAAVAVGLLTAYMFLGYDAEKTYFIAGPKRSGKTHAAVALHQEAVNHGYDPRNESSDLLELKSTLVEGDSGWLRPTENEGYDLSFSFTSQGLLRKNIHLQAVDYPGELLRAVIPAVRYHNESEEELVEEYPQAETREQWLQQRIHESKQEDHHYESSPSDAGSQPRADGGTNDRNKAASDDTEDPFAELDDDASAEAEEPDDNTDTERESRTTGTSKARDIVTQEIWPAFDQADTLLLVIDLERYLKDQPLEADALYNIYDKSEKDAIVLVTKADLIAEEFAESHGWKTAWARESYDEFRTYVQGELSEHNIIRQLLDNVERPYPVGYQTTEAEGGDEYHREIDKDSNLGSMRIEVHGYEYVIERMN